MAIDPNTLTLITLCAFEQETLSEGGALRHKLLTDFRMKLEELRKQAGDEVLEDYAQIKACILEYFVVK